MVDLERTETTKRTSVNWPERIAKLEANQVDPTRFAQIEAKLNQFCELIINTAEANQQSQIRNAKANERIAAHFEESRRVWERVDELQDSLQSMDKIIIELREQVKQMKEFTAGVQRAVWIAVTCGGVVLWWIIQRWVDSHGR